MILKIIGALFIAVGLLSGGSLFMLLLVPVGGAMIWLSSSKPRVSEGEKEFLSLPFVQRANYKHVFADSAIAISRAERKVLLASGKSIKQYGLDEIKSWEFKSDLSLSIADKIAHGMNYGFFVTVRDIENPVWRIAFNQNDPGSTLEMQRWMEIFDQYVNNA